MLIVDVVGGQVQAGRKSELFQDRYGVSGKVAETVIERDDYTARGQISRPQSGKRVIQCQYGTAKFGQDFETPAK